MVNRQTDKARSIFVNDWVGNHIRSAPTREGTAAGHRMENELQCMLLVTLMCTGTSIVLFKCTVILCKWSVTISFHFKTKPVTI